jgi:uncharacterized protein YqcC (DUF446 family)
MPDADSFGWLIIWYADCCNGESIIIANQQASIESQTSPDDIIDTDIDTQRLKRITCKTNLKAQNHAKMKRKGGYAGSKFSGASSYYHIQIAGYQRNFLLEDASVFENWQFDGDDFEVGDIAAFRINAADEPNLQKPTEYRIQRNISWPQEASSIKIYGLTINGQEVLSVGSTVRGQSYNRWFWLIVPLLIYVVSNVLIRTGFRNWTKKEEDKDLNKMISGMEKKEIYKGAEKKILSIENELIRLCEWQSESPNPAVFVDMGAFGSNTMPFTTWLQFVFIPNVKKIISTQSVFPGSSSVATYAYRNLEDQRYDRLNALLGEFDSLFNKG